MPRSPEKAFTYWVLTSQSPDGAVIDALPDGAPDGYLFSQGVSLKAKFPKNASVQFSDNFPDHRKLKDFQANILQTLIVSPKARKVIEGLEVGNAEFLDVAIKDHRGKVAAKDYALLNLIGAEDAIDMKRSTVRMSALDPTQIQRVNSLALDLPKIGPRAKLFRCSMERNLFLLRDDARKAFEAAGLTGLTLFPAEGWDGLPV